MRLRQSIAAASSLETWLTESSRLAVHLARQTKTRESRQLLAEIREKAKHTLIASTFARLHLAEAINCANDADLEMARRSCQRSYALSRIDGTAYCEVGAWLAHFEQNAGNEEKTVDLLRSTFEYAIEGDLGGVSRASLTLANELHSLDQFHVALEFYQVARRCAEILGDDATVAELLFNIAAFGIENSRIKCIDAEAQQTETAFFLSHARSAQRYCNLLCMNGGAWMFTLLEMNIEALTGRYSILSSKDIWGHLEIIQRSRPSLYWLHRADKLIADIRLNHTEQAPAELEYLLAHADRITSSEELAMFYWQLSKGCKLVKLDDRSQFCDRQIKIHLEILRVSRAKRRTSASLLAAVDAGRICLRRLELT